MFRRFSLLLFLFLVAGFFSKSTAQLSQETAYSGQSVVLRIDYCTNWIIVNYGSGQKEEIQLARDKKLSIKDQVSFINNILAEQLNKLDNAGYRVATSASDSNTGTTCGLTFILYKKE